MKNVLLVAIAAVFMLSSCVSMKHSYRTQDVNRSSIGVADNYVADLDIDFKTVLKGETTRNHKSEAQAKQEAYYQAIVSNNVHVLVDPIYSVSATKRWFGLLTTSTAKVVGFGAKYVNPRTANSDESESNGASVNTRLSQLERFSKINGVQQGITHSSYAIDTREGCCMEGSDNDNFGDTHLIHATENASSLVDEFGKFLELTDEACVGCSTATQLNIESGYSSDSTDKCSKGWRKVLSNTLGRLPIIGKPFRC
jgi:hypothetical protein